MKKVLLISSICAALFLIVSCGNNDSKTDTHQHDDGSSHADHDTVKPVQQEFNVADTAKKDTTHTHAEGEEHSH